MSSLPKEISVTEIANRISEHLKRIAQKERRHLEAVRKRPPEERQPYDDLPGYQAPHAYQAGRYVGISYISYHTPSNLTKREALHYLGLLDGGHEGQHFKLFRDHPVPDPEAPKVRYIAIVRTDYGFARYAVHRRTETRIYGERIEGQHVGTWTDRSKIVKLNSTPEDYQKLLVAREKMQAKIKEASAEFQSFLHSLSHPHDEQDQPEAEHHQA